MHVDWTGYVLIATTSLILFNSTAVINNNSIFKTKKRTVFAGHKEVGTGNVIHVHNMSYWRVYQELSPSLHNCKKPTRICCIVTGNILMKPLTGCLSSRSQS